MEKKGLCSTCIYDKECTFPRKFPVLQCEEFIGFKPKPTNWKKAERKKMKFDEEPMVCDLCGRQLTEKDEYQFFPEDDSYICRNCLLKTYKKEEEK